MQQLILSVPLLTLENSMEFSTGVLPEARELSIQELAILRRIIEWDFPARIHEIYRLKVIGRCRCGKCSTVFIGTLSTRIHLDLPAVPLAEYEGASEQGVAIGVALLTRAQQLSELEVWERGSGGHVEGLPNAYALVRSG